MISSEVQRTLVKSPPELWAELSDPATLARHLGDLGEIRITRTEPEKTVEWEATDTTGKVLLKPSGWGTKVTLSVSRELALTAEEPTPEEETEVVQAQAPSEELAAAAPEYEHIDSIDEDVPAIVEAVETVEESIPLEPVVVESVVVEPVVVESLVVEPRRGFFARLFGRRKPSPAEPSGPTSEQARLQADETSGMTEITETPQVAPLQPEPEPEANMQEREPPGRLAASPNPEDLTGEEPSEPAMDLAAELQAAEEVAAEEVTAILTALLDRLGAAHHRPFSRA
jgi:hypothetical protein